MVTRLIQLQKGGLRRIALVEGSSLRFLADVRSIYALATVAIARGVTLSEAAKEKVTERIPYYLYVDECNTILKYAENDFEKMLLRARKYKLCLTLANQFPVDLPPKIQNKLGSFGSYLLFNLKAPQAMPFKNFLNPYDFQQFQQLPKFHAIYLTSTDPARIVKTLPFFPDYRTIPGHVTYAQSIKKRIVDSSPCNTPLVPHTENSASSNHRDEAPRRTKGRPTPPRDGPQ